MRSGESVQQCRSQSNCSAPYLFCRCARTRLVCAQRIRLWKNPNALRARDGHLASINFGAHREEILNVGRFAPRAKRHAAFCHSTRFQRCFCGPDATVFFLLVDVKARRKTRRGGDAWHAGGPLSSAARQHRIGPHGRSARGGTRAATRHFGSAGHARFSARTAPMSVSRRRLTQAHEAKTTDKKSRSQKFCVMNQCIAKRKSI